jgi:hypothetical protein
MVSLAHHFAVKEALERELISLYALAKHRHGTRPLDAHMRHEQAEKLLVALETDGIGSLCERFVPELGKELGEALLKWLSPMVEYCGVSDPESRPRALESLVARWFLAPCIRGLPGVNDKALIAELLEALRLEARELPAASLLRVDEYYAMVVSQTVERMELRSERFRAADCWLKEALIPPLLCGAAVLRDVGEVLESGQ